MFGIPELNDMVCSLVDLDTLYKCVLVSKAWNGDVTPALWRRIPILASGSPKQIAFARLILEDLIADRENDQSPPKALSRNGRFINHVDNYRNLFQVIRTATAIGASYENPPSEEAVFEHFLRKTWNIDNFEALEEYFTTPGYFNMVCQKVPLVRSLTISAAHESCGCISVEMLKSLLAAAGKVRYLTLNIFTFQKKPTVAPPEQSAPGPRKTSDNNLQFHTLKITAIGRKTDSPKDLSWLWNSCSKLTVLEILYIPPPAIKSLSEGISSTARLLQVVSFGRTVHDRDYIELMSHDIATLVGSGEGWKVIHFFQTALFGPEALEALLKKHSDSVKEIKLMKMEENTNIKQILASCPCLESFRTIENRKRANTVHPEIPFKRWVDWDPQTKNLRPWRCEKSLIELAVKIVDVHQVRASPDFEPTATDVTKVRTQHKAWERLARCHNLRRLWLGHTPSDRGRVVALSMQTDCLQLTMLTGLDRLVDLERLEELNVSCMRHGIGVNEVEWMKEHWPQLSKLTGLPKDSLVRKWVEKNYQKLILQ